MSFAFFAVAASYGLATLCVLFFVAVPVHDLWTLLYNHAGKLYPPIMVALHLILMRIVGASTLGQNSS